MDEGRRADDADRPPALPVAVRGAVHTDGWGWIRRAAGLVYVGVLVYILVSDGVPTGRQAIAILIVTGLCITRIGRGWRPFFQVFVDWLPFTLVLVAYDKTRAVADAVGLPLHEGDIVGAERSMSGGVVPTVWLQQHLYDAQHVFWYDAFCTVVYSSHFVATPVLAAALWLRARPQWLRFISRVIVLSAAGLLTYIVFPEAPPWLAAQDGFIHLPVARLSARGWIWLHLGDIDQALAHAQEGGSNPVAAMPSLHIAFACLVALFLGSRLRSAWRWLLVLYPCAMGFTLVYLGEHYVIDLLAGVAYALAVHVGLNRWERGRATVAAHEPAPAVAASADGAPAVAASVMEVAGPT